MARARECPSRCRFAGFLLLALLLSDCVNHHLIHSRRPPPGADRWSEVVTNGTLRMRLEWVRPAKLGPLPVVIVHPEARHGAVDMSGILNDLAEAGYLAVGVDYSAGKGLTGGRVSFRGKIRGTPNG